MRRYLRARQGDRDAVDDHLVGGSQARADDPQAVAKIAELDLLGRHDVVRPDGQDDVLRLIRQHRRVRHEQSRRWWRGFQAHAGEATRRQEQVAVGHGGAGMNRAAGPVERIVDEVECAFTGEARLVAQGHLHLVCEWPVLLLTGPRNVM